MTSKSLGTLVITATIALTGLVVPFAMSAPAAHADDPWTLPVPPPRCTTQQANSGNVANCLLAFYGYPGSQGWGEPPQPGVGPGWNWSANSYSGSPALAEFEAAYIRANVTRLGDVRPGDLETHVAAQALFEGFLNEITARGYEVNHASGYSFRCTSGNGGWSCPSGDTADLSLHAWGLAVDMNSATNPIRSYSSVNGQSACLTPIVTDFPRWAIQAAERWGLYWGGYGWNDGCNEAGAMRTSVSRDAPHFEFRGTPAQAAAIVAYNMANDPSRVCRTVVNDAGTAVESCNLSGRPDAGQRLPVTLDAPTGATAALINLTATAAAGPGFFTLENCGARTGDRSTSAITYAAGESVAALAIVPLDASKRFCVYRSTAAHSVVDVVAFITPGTATAPAAWLQTSSPVRVLDTRNATPVGADAQQPLPANGDSTAQSGRLVNLVAVGRGDPGFLQAGSCDVIGDHLAFSNVNYNSSEVRSNLTVIADDSADGCVYSLAGVDVVVDELAVLDPVDGYGWSVAPVRRAFDSRTSATTSRTTPSAGSLLRIDLGTQAPAAAIAITVTNTKAAGYVTVGRCDELSAAIAARGAPTTSNVNHMAGQTVTNLAVVPLDGGTMCVYTLSAADVIVDVQAELVNSRVNGIVVGAPVRAHDSRLTTG
jgi:hypothetical protein